jgi:hypothetical protein
MKLDDEIKRLLKQVVDHFDKEDRAARDRQLRTWRKLKLLWDNLQYHFYSEVAHDWRIPENEREGNDQSYYDKPVNVFRAYLESIIAALSITVPSITCFPDDADNPLDVTTARAGDKIAELIFRHNDAPLLWLHALFIYCTEGMMACYSYPKEDKAFGTYKESKYEDVTEESRTQVCPSCGFEMASNPDEFMPDGEMDVCPQCAMMVSPETQTSQFTATRLVGEFQHPKARIMMEVFGGLYIKVPIWARKQSDCPYLIYSYETHYSNVLEQYPEFRDKLPKSGASGIYDTHEQWGRLSPQYQGMFPNNNVTVRNSWLRPSAFNVLNEEDVPELKKLYPDGAKVVMVNDNVVDAENEALDDYWTILYNPLSDYIHFDPLGLLLTSIQEITNDIVSLTLQTIEHGIPQTFANPRVLDFKTYRESEALPGGIYPATPMSGKPVSDGFYEVRTATLSGEVLPFASKIQEMGQIVSGALPSLFGGQMSGSRTASEYSMSRAQALQRLQTTWKSLTMWWKNIFAKVIPLYIKEMKEDERNVSKDEMGNFINVFVRKAELEGKIGRIELEANENLPVTWSQQKDTIMQLLDTNNQEILATLASPENMPYLRRAIGLPDYIIPGESDRQKQYEEIVQLVNSTPMQIPPDPMMMQQYQMVAMQSQMNGMPPPPEPQPEEVPSIEVDPDVDNHAIEGEICRIWLVSDAGRLCKIENPEGYRNVLLHMKMHRMIIEQQQQMAMMQASGAAAQQPNGNASPNPENPNGQVTQ